MEFHVDTEDKEIFRVSTDRTMLNVPLIHQFLSGQSTWAKGIALSVVRRAIDNSLCFGGYVGSEQIAFARVISDFSTFANLVDVFVVPSHRGRGFAKTLMHEVLAHPQLQGRRRFTLATSDAHGLYAPLGFASPARPGTLMERYFPNIYTGNSP
jgi:GNAT superfamily N-acetyltransferase